MVGVRSLWSRPGAGVKGAILGTAIGGGRSVVVGLLVTRHSYQLTSTGSTRG